MSLRVRRLFVALSVLLFIIALGPILFYTLGYRFSFTDLSVRTTGGLFINTAPVRTLVHINDTEQSTSFITGDLFVQNLKPGSHHIVIEKDGFYAWEKNLIIEPHSVEEAYVVLIPKEGATSTLAVGSFSSIHGSPSGRYLLPIEPSTNNTVRLDVFDTQLNVFLKPHTRQKTTLLSIPRETSLTPLWHTENAALIETSNDWLLLSITSDGTYTLKSLYAQSELFATLMGKPEIILPHPTDADVYFVLSDTSLYIWRTKEKLLQPVLETIAGIALHGNQLISLDAVHGNLYTSTLTTGNAKIISTSSISVSGTSLIYEAGTSYIIHNKNAVLTAV